MSARTNRVKLGAEEPDRLRAYVHLGYGFGAEHCRQLHDKRLAPDPVPYGFHHAEEFGAAVTYSLDHPESTPAQLFRRGLQRVLGFDLVHAYRNRSAMAKADVVWTMEEKQFLAVLLWGRLLPSLRRKKVIAQTIWLYDRWAGTPRLKRWLLSNLIKRAAALTVHSRNYVGRAELTRSSIFPKLLPFGISQDAFPLTEEFRERHSPIRILSMGNDPTRDWDTLLDAFGNDNRFSVIVITKAIAPSRLSAYANVAMRNEPTTDTFRECYAWADFVVIPMSANLYSGITVALEAVSMGVPVVSSATGGVPTYFDPDEVLYVPPLDPQAMRQAVIACLDDQRISLSQRARKRFINEKYSSRGMAQRYVRLSRKILAARS